MKQLTFSDHFHATSISTKDFGMFMSMLAVDQRFLNRKVNVTRTRYSNDPENDLMMTVEIDFQSWGQGQYGTGDTWTWICYRAKNFSCSSGVRIEESRVSKLVKQYMEENKERRKIPGSKWISKVKGLDEIQLATFFDQLHDAL